MTFLVSKTSRLALRPTQPPILWAPRFIPSGFKRSVDHNQCFTFIINFGIELVMETKCRLHMKSYSDNVQECLLSDTSLIFQFFNM